MYERYTPPTDRERLEDFRESLITEQYARAGCAAGTWSILKYLKADYDHNRLNVQFDLIRLAIADYPFYAD
jgi:hypothetical protein